MAQIDILRTASGSVAVPAIGYGAMYIDSASSGAAWKDSAGTVHGYSPKSVYDVTDYGLVPNSTAAAGANVTAINSLLGSATPGSLIYFPVGVFYFNAAWATVASGFYFKGVYGGTSIAMTANVAANWINCTHASQPYSFEGLMFFSSGVTQTAGFTIEFNSTLQPLVLNCQWNGGGGIFQMYSCIDFSGSNGGNGSVVQNCNFGQFKGIGINSSGNQGSQVIANCLWNGNNADGSFALAGIQVSTVGATNGGSVLIDSCDVIKCQNNLLLTAATGTTLASVFAVNTFFDQSIGSCVKITGAGTQVRHRFSNCWMTVHGTSSSANAIEISTTGSSVHAGIEINDCWILNTPAGGGSPVGINATAVSDFVVNNCQIAGWTTGISVTPAGSAGTTKPFIQGSKIGPVGGVGGNGTGILLNAGAVTYGSFAISDNDLSGNTTAPLTDNSLVATAGQQKVVANNLGLGCQNAVMTTQMSNALATEQVLLKVPVPARGIRAGTAVRFTIKGSSGSATAANKIVSFEYGTGGVGADTAVGTFTLTGPAVTAVVFEITGLLVFSSGGATAVGQCSITGVHSGSTTVAAAPIIQGSRTATASIDTTVDKFLTLTVTNSAAQTTNYDVATIECIQQ